jgi:hypothetical protein
MLNFRHLASVARLSTLAIIAVFLTTDWYATPTGAVAFGYLLAMSILSGYPKLRSQDLIPVPIILIMGAEFYAGASSHNMDGIRVGMGAIGIAAAILPFYVQKLRIYVARNEYRSLSDVRSHERRQRPVRAASKPNVHRGPISEPMLLKHHE